MGVRERVAGLVALAVVLPASLLVLWAETDYEAELIRREADELLARGHLLAELTRERSFTDALADRIGELSELRVTLIDGSGTVLGDSEVPAARLAAVENHSGRPEVRAALEGREGTAKRASATVSLSLLYAAVPHSEGVLRVAEPLVQVTAPADRLVRTVIAGASALLLLLLVTAGLQARFLLAPLRPLRRGAQRLAGGDSARPRDRGHDRDEVGRLTTALHEVADRFEAAEKSDRRRSEIETVVDRLDEGIVLVDEEGLVRRSNRAFRRWVGREDVEGHGLRALFRDPQISAVLERALAGEQGSEEVEVGERSLLVSVRPLGEGALAVFRDLTRIRRLEGVRRDFVANVSHELKTPLTSVLGFAEPLTDPDLPREQVLEFAERILVNGARMRRLVDDLLDLSRIEAGAWEPKPGRVALDALSESIWRDLVAGAEGVEPELRVDASAAPAVRADPEAVRQILRNLLDNALRYAPEESVVQVGARPDGAMVRVEVADRGPGIPAAHRERVFERFYRMDAGRSREAGGTGLGLSIVKHLVAAHGGQVGIESRVGEGATVWFTLPAPDEEDSR